MLKIVCILSLIMCVIYCQNISIIVSSGTGSGGQPSVGAYVFGAGGGTVVDGGAGIGIGIGGQRRKR